ncbi:MAG: hypothetical protein Q9216_001875 [Gyalolechia sp. 2 TL-2023]
MNSKRLLAILIVATFSDIAFSLQGFVNSRSWSTPIHTAATVSNGRQKIAGRVASTFGPDSPTEYLGSIQELEGEGHFHRKRAPNTLSYTDAVCKGEKYLGLIQQGSPTPPVFTQDDFKKGGWTEDSTFPQVIADDLKTPIQALGIPSAPKDIRRISAQQYSEFTNMNGQIQDDVSGAQFLQVYIPSATKGTIIASENVSPEQSIAMYRRENNLPQLTAAQLRDYVPNLRRWSDVVWFVWAKQAGNQAGKLRYIFRDNVVTAETKGVIDQMFGIPKGTLDLKWPGKTFDVKKTKEGKGLLGTAHGSGIAWLMADHKAELGERNLKVTVFTSAGSHMDQKTYNMLFELADP